MTRARWIASIDREPEHAAELAAIRTNETPREKTMARVRLTADVEPEMRQRVKIAAVRNDESVSAWVERAVERELEREEAAPASIDDDEEMLLPPPGVKPRGLDRTVKLRGGGTMSDTVIEDREERDRMLAGGAGEDRIGSDLDWYREGMATLPPPGAKPKGTSNPPKLRDGSLISDAVIEDRR